MDMHSGNQYPKKLQKRYFQARSRKEKSSILDEYCRNTNLLIYQRIPPRGSKRFSSASPRFRNGSLLEGTFGHCQFEKAMKIIQESFISKQSKSTAYKSHSIWQQAQKVWQYCTQRSIVHKRITKRVRYPRLQGTSPRAF